MVHGSAVCCRRAATFTASPVIRKSLPCCRAWRPLPPVFDPDRLLGTELRIRVDAVADLERRRHRALGIVTVRLGKPEDGHHGVADELLEGAAVRADHSPRDGVVVVEGTNVLGSRDSPSAVAPVVCEQHGHDAALFGHVVTASLPDRLEPRGWLRPGGRIGNVRGGLVRRATASRGGPALARQRPPPAPPARAPARP